jgi:hypothetical protein
MTATAKRDRFSAEERAAMKERSAELKSEAKRAGDAQRAAADEADVLAKIAQMPDADQTPDGFWPTSYALQDPSEQAWENLGELIKRAARISSSD